MNLLVPRREFIRNVSFAALAAGGQPSALAAGKTITMGLVGCAHIHTPGYINLLHKRQDVTVKSVWDHDVAPADKKAKEQGDRRVKDASPNLSDHERARA